MIRLHILVEGETEERFVKRVLAPHLEDYSVRTSVICLGGWNSYQKAQREIWRWWRDCGGEDAWFTTMLDLYKIPLDFPGLDGAKALRDPYKRVSSLEERFSQEIATDEFWRFIPHLQLHEFEALILADPAKLDWEFLEHDEAISKLVSLTKRYDSPELINDGPETAPSKRIIREIPTYEKLKPKAGPIVAGKISLPVMRARCPHFGGWVTRLETLDKPA